MRKPLTAALASLSAFAVVAAAIGCTSAPKKQGENDPELRGRMHAMAAALGDLFPYVVSAREFHDPKNEERIRASAESLATAAGGLADEKHIALMEKADPDPSLPLLATVLEKEIQLSVEGLRTGQKDYARVVLRNVTGVCVQCHSRGNFGPQLESWAYDPRRQNLSRVEHGDLLAAMRQYDEALALYQTVLQDPAAAKARTFEWEGAAEAALSLAVRVKQSPDLALRIVDRVLENKQAAYFIRRDAGNWRKQLLAWKREKQAPPSLARARQLIQAAVREQQDFDDRSHLVSYLRASAILHDLMRTRPEPAASAEAMYLLGRSYEGMQARGWDTLNQFYYTACIKALPRTPAAKTCYDSLEENVFADALRSGGFAIPPRRLDYLNYLRELAEPQATDNI